MINAHTLSTHMTFSIQIQHSDFRLSAYIVDVIFIHMTYDMTNIVTGYLLLVTQL